jgi:hypothetical protein
MSAQVARALQSGPVFLVGDAAHRFPPTGGLGLNTGVADAHNLAWKIAACEKGWGSQALLDTYEAERRPVAQNNTTQSLLNAVQLGTLMNAVQSQPDLVSTEAGRSEVRAKIAEMHNHFDSLRLQLGYVYGDPGYDSDRAVHDFVPALRVGARLPHAWVERDGARISTLDLIPLDRFALLTSDPAWAAEAETLSQKSIPLDVVLVGRDVVDIDGDWGRVSELPAAGAVLVRPDQHVAWRAFDASADSIAGLGRALQAMIA